MRSPTAQVLALDQEGFSSDLTDREWEALQHAATWYFKHHAPMITDLADDESAFAISKRDEFLALHTALRKLGIRLSLPDSVSG